MEEQIKRKTEDIVSVSNLELMANIITREVCSALAEEVDELNVSSHLFKDGVKRAFIRVMNFAQRNEQQFYIFPDSLPGFTLMALKKEAKVSKGEKVQRNPKTESAELDAIDAVLKRFQRKNEGQILMIDTIDFAFVLFPISDTKKHLKELDLYITF